MNPYLPSSSLSSQAPSHLAPNPFLSSLSNNTPSSKLDQQNPLPRPPGTEASIWAPPALRMQKYLPKPSQPLMNYAQDEYCMYGAFGVSQPPAPPITHEDVFEPSKQLSKNIAKSAAFLPFPQQPRLKPSIFPEDEHVEQLLRTLDLNSPVLCPPALSPVNPGLANRSGSPDFSPLSTPTSLTTPIDGSPMRFSFNQKLGLANYPPAFDQPLAYSTGSSPKSLFPSSASSDPFLDSKPAVPAHYMVPPLDSPISPSFSFLKQESPFTPDRGLGITFPDPAVVDRMPNAWSQIERMRFAPETNWARDEVIREVVADDPALLTRRPFLRPSPPTQPQPSGHLAPPPHEPTSPPAHMNEPINFLSLLHPSSTPPYHTFVARIVKNSDQQASIFLQQKLKVADSEERFKIIDAVCTRGYEMMVHRFGNWAVQRCLEAARAPEEKRKIIQCMQGRVVELAMNCYGCHVLQKALDCEEDVRLLIVSELLRGDPSQSLVNKHASHVWSKVMELVWTPPAPPIFEYINKSLKGKWASLACHEIGSLVVQHAFENLEESSKDDIINELLGQGSHVFAEVAKNQWGAYCIQHILEHGSEKHRHLALQHLLEGLLDYATHDHGSKSVAKALKEGGVDTMDNVIKRLCEPTKKGGRRAMLVDLALSVSGSHLITSVLPHADKDQRAALYDCIKGHIVTLRGCKTGSKVIWLFDRMVRSPSGRGRLSRI